MNLDVLPGSGNGLDLSEVDRIVASRGDGPEAILPILQAIQSHYHYLPEPALRQVARITGLSPAALVGVATFYSRFRHKPTGQHIFRVCHGTACHVKGAQLVEDSIRRHLKMSATDETDSEGRFTIERVGCIGCCTLAPVTQIDQITYGHQASDTVGDAIRDFLSRNGKAAARPTIIAPTGPAIEVRVGCGSCCLAGGSGQLRDALEAEIARRGARAVVKPVGCVGMCHQTPMVEMVGSGGAGPLYTRVGADDAAAIVRRHLRPAGFFARLRSTFSGWLDSWIEADQREELDRHLTPPRDQAVCEFLGPQVRIATEHAGRLSPLDLDEYVRLDGFAAVRRALKEMTPNAIVDEVEKSGLRGRGGAGFPTGRKWRLVSEGPPGPRYVVCNGDEGDPGAFMDRMILESFPYRVIEGMTIAAAAVGAEEGIFYIRAEYPLALERVSAALDQARQRGFLGDNILGSGRRFDIRIVEGGGAFVCGEETALIASIEGRRGAPRLRPPYPAVSGLHGRPTLINNVESLAMVPWIIRHGAEPFAAIGTATSKGTKVFALTGKIRRGGLVEVPMGLTIRRIVEEVGGGIADGRRFKAVQIGGPSGGCIPESMADLPIDYESLSAAGAIMGSGGLVVLDDRDCMVDIARFFLQFTQAESCGKCTFCRVGTKVMLDILTRLCEGTADKNDLAKLEDLAFQVKRASLCGLGQTAPNPVLTTLKYFREEYEAHLRGRCPAGKCQKLIHYRVHEGCIGCTLCAQHCPSDAIPMLPYQKHAIDDARCTRCDVCRKVCPVKAITVE